MERFEAKVMDIISLDPQDGLAQVEINFKKAYDDSNGTIIFYGAGELGRFACASSLGTKFAPSAFVDSNSSKHGETINGVPIISLSTAIEQFGRQALFIPTVYTRDGLGKMLSEIGLLWRPFPEFAWSCLKGSLPYFALALPTVLDGNTGKILETAALWSDEQSAQEFRHQIQWRANLDSGGGSCHSPVDEQYFHKEIVDFREDEVFVDCGAFDGDTFRWLNSKFPNSKFRYIGVEPDKRNLDKLVQSVNGNGSLHSAGHRICPFALGKENGLCSFNDSGSASSSMQVSASDKVEVKTLDELLEGEKPTYIKMDIEGAEIDALLGAKKTIKEFKPVLAICLYHKPSDLWEIPLLIKELEPSYRMYLRRYSSDCWESVCYAVPQER